MPRVLYQGLFLSPVSTAALRDRTRGLDLPVQDLHITFAFRPAELFPTELLGRPFQVTVVGYGNDGQNEGFAVELPDSLTQYFQRQSVPHITVSLAHGAKAVDTGRMEFTPISPFKLDARLGFYAGSVRFA